MSSRGATTVTLAASALALSGCGVASSARPPTGRALFVQACSACHSLTGADNPHLQGGDLLHFRSSRGQLVQFAREMPVRRALTPSQLQTVVDYVREIEQRGS